MTAVLTKQCTYYILNVQFTWIDVNKIKQNYVDAMDRGSGQEWN